MATRRKRRTVVRAKKIRYKRKTFRTAGIHRKTEELSPVILQEIHRIKKKRGVGANVFSSWIKSLQWIGDKVRMVLLNDYEYDVYVTFQIFEQWIQAGSKGTYFNYLIRDRYKVVRIK